MKRQWLAILLTVVLTLGLLCIATAETPEINPEIPVPTNVQVSATTVGKPFTVTWDCDYPYAYQINVYDTEDNRIASYDSQSHANMLYTVFRLMPGTYSVGVQGWEWEGRTIYGEESARQTMTVAASGKTWDYVITNGKVKILAYYGSETSVQVPDTIADYPVTEIGANAFYYRDINSVQLPSSVNEIGAAAFANSSLRAITIGANARVDENAFFNCSPELTVNGVHGSDAEAAAIKAGAVFNPTSETLPTAPTATARGEEYNAYNLYFDVCDPDAERYEYLLKYWESSDMYVQNETLDINYPGQAASMHFSRFDGLTSYELVFRALKNGVWSAWSVPFTGEFEGGSGESDMPELSTAIPLTDARTVINVQGNRYSLISIEPETTEVYTFYTESEDYQDTLGTLFDATGMIITQDDESGNNGNFYLSYELQAGQKYYLGVRFWNENQYGNVDLITENSLFNPLAKPEITVSGNDNGEFVLSLSAANAENFMLKITLVGTDEPYFEEINLEAENGNATYVLPDRSAEGGYYTVSAKTISRDEKSAWTAFMNVKAVGQGTENGLVWKMEENGEITICEYLGHDTIVVIPAMINGIPVTKIGPLAFVDNTDLVKVILPEGILEIGNNAFDSCYNLYSVQLPESLKVIGNRAFRWNFNLCAINLPSNLEKIGIEAFMGCNGLTWIAIPDGVSTDGAMGIFQDCVELVIEGTVGSDAWKTANNSGIGFVPINAESQPEPKPEVSVSGPLYGGCSTTVSFTMPGADLFRVSDTREVLELGDDPYRYRNVKTYEIPAENGNGEYEISDEDGCYCYYLLVSARVNGEWSPWSDVIVLKPQYKGHVEKPVVTISGPITAGNEYTVTCSNVENAGTYEVYISDADTPDVKTLITTSPENEMVQVWANTAGDYLLTVKANGENGWLSSESDPIPVTVSAGDSDFLYSEYGDGLCLDKYIGLKTVQEITVPSEIDGMPVIRVEERAFENLPMVHEIVLPDTVTEVGWCTFSNCPNLESIVFNGPVTLWDFFTDRCGKLHSITFNDSGAFVQFQIIKDMRYTADSLVLRGFAGSDIEIAAEQSGCQFESIGTLEACPEFSVTPMVVHEDGLVYPGEAYNLKMNDPETTEIEYRMSFTALEIDEYENEMKGCWSADEGVVNGTIYMYSYMTNARLSVRAFRNGVWTRWSEPVELATVSERLPQVTGVRVVSENGKMTITWDAVENASAYMVAICPVDERWFCESWGVYRAESYTVPVTLESGLYDVYVAADQAVSGDMLRGVFSEKTTVSLEKDSRERYFDISAEEGIKDFSPALATAHADGDPYIEICWLDDEGIPHLYSNGWNGTAQTWLNIGGTHTYIARVSWDGGETFEEIGRHTVTINPLGTLDNPVIDAPMTLTKGEDLAITVGAVEHAAEYSLSVQDDYYNPIYDGVHVLPGEPFVIPATELTTERNYIYVNVFAKGYESGFAARSVMIMPETVNPIDLTVDHATIEAGDMVTLTVKAPGATAVALYTDNNQTTYTDTSDNGIFEMKTEIRNSGEYVFYARAYYGELENYDPWNSSVYDGPSKPIHVYCFSRGDAPLPEVTVKEPSEENDSLTFVLTPTDIADWYRIILYENSGYMTQFDWSVNPENPMEQLTASYPTELMREGCTYSGSIWAGCHGYDDKDQRITEFAYTKPGTEEPQYFRVSSTTGTVRLSPIYMVAHADGANAIQIRHVNPEGDEIESLTEYGRDATRMTLSDFCDEREYIAYASSDDGVTWTEIGRQTVSIDYPGEYFEFTIYGDRLIISGVGEMPDYEIGWTPWADYAGSVEQIIFEEGVTGIGTNAFNGFDQVKRIDFYQNEMPVIAENAFTGVDAIARYYSEPGEEWQGQYGGNLQWIWLPYNNSTNKVSGLLFGNNHMEGARDEAPLWSVAEGGNASNSIYLTPDQAYATMNGDFDVVLYTLPEPGSAEASVYEDHIDQVAWMSFGPLCAGAYTLDITEESGMRGVGVTAPDFDLTVNLAEEKCLEKLSVGEVHQLVFNGDMDALELKYCLSFDSTVVVNGNIGLLEWYSATSEGAYLGSLTCNGLIHHGNIYSSNSIDIPNVGAVNFDLEDCTFDNQTGQIITNGELALPAEAVHGQTKLELGMCNLAYFVQYLDDGRELWMVEVRPKPECGIDCIPALAYIKLGDSEEYPNPNFSIEDILYGDNITLTVDRVASFIGDDEYIEVGQPGQTLNHLVLYSGAKVKLECPVDEIEVFRTSSEKTELLINSTVPDLYMYDVGKDCNIMLGENGKIARVTYQSPLRGYRYIANVAGPVTLMRNGHVEVMSKNEGDQIASITASDEVLTSAAGLTDGLNAGMDIRQDYGDLTDTETEILTAVMNASETAEVVGVMNVDVFTYDDENNKGDNLTELQQPVSFYFAAPSDAEEDDCYTIINLHEDENGMTGSIVGESDGTQDIPVTTDKFSRFVIMKTKNRIDLAGMTVLKLPDSLNTIEPEAFAGTAAEVIILPDGCTSVGSKAFADCDNLVYVFVPASLEGKLPDDVFDGCENVQIIVKSSIAE